MEEEDRQTMFWVEGRVSDGEPSRGSRCLIEAKKHQGQEGNCLKGRVQKINVCLECEIQSSEIYLGGSGQPCLEGLTAKTKEQGKSEIAQHSLSGKSGLCGRKACCV